jgi:hypothetical protein
MSASAARSSSLAKSRSVPVASVSMERAASASSDRVRSSAALPAMGSSSW